MSGPSSLAFVLSFRLKISTVVQYLFFPPVCFFPASRLFPLDVIGVGWGLVFLAKAMTVKRLLSIYIFLAFKVTRSCSCPVSVEQAAL